jgi:hypothetical protein
VVLVLLRNDFPSPSGACCPLIKEGAEKCWKLGPILVSILINWLLLIWLSASLFISQPDSLMNVETNSPTVVNKIFYTGYTLSTLGLRHGA